MSYFSQKLKELRSLNGLLQKEIAEDLGMPLTTYHHYEKGRTEPPYDVLIKIAEYYNITVDELLGTAPISREKGEQENEVTELLKSYSKLNKEQRQHVRIVIGTLLRDKEKIYKEIFTDENDTDIFKRG